MNRLALTLLDLFEPIMPRLWLLIPATLAAMVPHLFDMWKVM